MTKILLSCLLLASLGAAAQNGVQLYGFQREIQFGIVPRATDENTGKPIPARDAAIEYLIYISAPSGQKLVPVEIWIKGRPFNVKSERISKTPVAEPSGKVLVPAYNGNIWKLIPGTERKGTRFTLAKEKSKKNEAVLVYSLNGRHFSATLAKIGHLPPALNE